MIEVNGRIADITKVYSPSVWRLKFRDNLEIINVFYSKEHKYSFVK